MAKKNRNSRRINFENNTVEVNEEQSIAVSEESVKDSIDVNVDVLNSENTDTVETPTVDTLITDNTEVVDVEETDNENAYSEPENEVKEYVEPVMEVEEVVTEVVDNTVEVEAPEVVVEPEPEVKEVVSKPEAPKDNISTGANKFQIVFVDRGSPLQLQKTLKRLKSIGEPYDVDDSINTISGRVFSSYPDAISHRKYLAGKGLKPIIKKI